MASPRIKKERKLNGKRTLFVEDRESEIGGLERCILCLAEQQEILGLQIPMNNPHRMARVHNLHNSPEQGGGRTLRVVALCYDAVEELPTGAELHDEVDRVLVLVGPLELDDVGLAREVVHDLDLTAHVLDVLLVGQLALGDGDGVVAVAAGLAEGSGGTFSSAAPREQQVPIGKEVEREIERGGEED
ncbi:Unknown protein [Striga hermonthica]|uniref:Uncharacterized protein n=1 Tax=Striga hermonthica TaxID=68872 RepID=A0A9N7MZG7_STRHE|nr:Unknown protein [Striga hermonthica]